MTHPGTVATSLTDAGGARPSLARAIQRFANLRSGLVVLAMAAVQTPAAAERVFFDDFNAEAGGGTAIFQQALSQWDVLGAVDVIGTDNTLGYQVDSTMIDLGGGLSGGFITTQQRFSYQAESVVTLSWDMGGNQIRPDGEDIPYFQFYFDQSNEEQYQEVQFIRGTGFFSFVDYPSQGEVPPIRIFDEYFAYSYGLFGDYPVTRQSISFQPLLAGAFRFQLGTLSGGGYGPLIDNVAVDVISAPVPEPESWALMIAGMVMIGARIKRRSLLLASE